MKRSRTYGIVIGGVSLLASLTLRVGLAAAQPQLTDDELKCQIGESKTVGKFVASKAKCVTKCEAGARKGKNPQSDCAPPYAGATAQCVATAEQKATDGLVKVCAKDCPECYGDCSRTAAEMVVMGNEQTVDSFVPIIFCDDSGSPDGLTKDEGKCQATVAKALSKFVGAKLKCYEGCRSAEHKGSIPSGSCDPPASDAKTQTCIGSAEAKASGAIDKRCSAGNNNPECYGTAFDTGEEWVGPVEGNIDNAQPNLYCGSPSGAFLD